MIISFDELKSELFKFRKNNKEIISNYIFQNLEDKEIYLFENNGLLFFAYDKEYKIYKMFYMVHNLESLDELLLKANWNNNIALEIIEKSDLDKNLVKIFNKYNFLKFAVLEKMSFLTNMQDIIQNNDSIKYCDKLDLFELKKIFFNKFNKYSESLPSKVEVNNAIESKLIIKLVDEDKIIGFLWFNQKKVLTELRYLFVDENYRGQKLSLRLMEQYLFLTHNIRKKQLWVLKDNQIAINIYKKLGYEFENLKDNIFKKEVSK